MAPRDIDFPQSSNISGITYDDDTQELIVMFIHGGIYRYPGVTSNEADGFSSAESAGKYLNEFIKPLHQHERLS